MGPKRGTGARILSGSEGEEKRWWEIQGYLLSYHLRILGRLRKEIKFPWEYVSRDYSYFSGGL